MDENRFETILKNRAVPQAPSNLAQRIIDQAAQMPVAARARQVGWIEALRESLIIPRPEWAFAAILLMGIALGNYSNDWISVSDDYSSHLSYAFMIDESFNTGEFL